jgi:hypothetical protein
MSRYETAPYKVLVKEDNFELRQYDSYYTAAVDEKSLNGSSGFSQIFDYISGSNDESKKISMTTPVFNEMGKDSVSTEFVMPGSFSEETLPEPENKKIRIKRNESRLAASVTFSGNVSDSKIRDYEKKLLEWVSKKDITPVGNFYLARYNPPFIPPFLRRNEVLIDVLRNDPA